MFTPQEMSIMHKALLTYQGYKYDVYENGVKFQEINPEEFKRHEDEMVVASSLIKRFETILHFFCEIDENGLKALKCLHQFDMLGK